MHEKLITDFYLDPAERERVFAHPDPAYRAGVETFILELAAYGIGQRRIDLETFDLFGHRGIGATIDRFIAAHPFDELPLEGVTVVQYARRGRCEEDWANILRQLREHRDRMRYFATRYNIDVRVHIYLQDIDPSAAGEVARFVDSGAMDLLGFFYDFAPLTGTEASALRASLARFAEDPVLRNPKIRIGNFPFCFFPPEKFKLAYKDAVAPLKGHIGAQRDVIRDLGKKPFAYHEPCGACRCRAACYAHTDIAECAGYSEVVLPRQEEILVFAGGSVAPEDRQDAVDLVWTSPAEQGDLVAAVLEGFSTILLLDGYFHSTFPCTTFEVMLALEAGVNVFGAASMGALRAVELDRYGMEGMGYVYNYLRQQEVKPYHVVAQTYHPMGDRPLTPPLIQIIYFLERAAAEAILSEEETAACQEVADHIHFMELSFSSLFHALRAMGGATAQCAEKLELYLEQAGETTFDIKRQDACLLLHTFRSVLEHRKPGHVKRVFEKARKRTLKLLFDKYPGQPFMDLPPEWRNPGSVAGPAGGGDRRACPAEMTCERARQFFADLDIVVADTTKYDRSGSTILSAFLVPFYFLDYYPAAATGNGAVFEEALASAYMELVERVSVCGMHIREWALEEWGDPEFPVERLPQMANWGTYVQYKQNITDLHGYVRVTDIVTGRNVIIPKFTVMFAYSGTDGYAAGNTLSEAVLYGLYELVERDTCQTHLLDPELRRRLPEFRINPGILDERCRSLLDQAEARGCRMVLFSLPNLYRLPCVMCHVYDRNQRIQSHGGIAVRSDVQAAAFAALHEAAMQYITYYAGTRDDYRPFAPLKRASMAYADAQAMFFDEPGSASPPPSRSFDSIGAELDDVMDRLTRADIEHILVADTSPHEEFGLHSVKVIVPRLELWFCPKYQPSPSFAERVAAVRELQS